ncbi:MAG TPA: sensor histidine kinase [Thermoanaerobaculia bacterium]|nr:sensor histidine kinase [Thermoanaerobaculia bacterium]
MNTRQLTFVGYLTWLIIGVPSVMWELRHHTLFTPRAGIWAVCFVLFIIAFGVNTRTEKHWLWLLILQAVFALACVAAQPLGGMQPILLVIVAGQLSGVSVRNALLFDAALMAGLYAAVYRTGDGVMIVCAYFAFTLFAMITIRVAHDEGEARKSLAEANAELKVATELLQISSRTDERLRIARDLHDLLGHHLTALSLNLEVASHLTSGEARETIEKSKSITKLLLSDVRDVVSAMRHDEAVDLGAAIESISAAVTTPQLHVEVDRDLAVTNAAVAQTALRALQEIVTNAVRHSGARNLWLHVSRNDGSLAIDAKDDGVGCDYVAFGNGLRGMRERVEAVRGSLEVISSRGKGFEVRVMLPA